MPRPPIGDRAMTDAERQRRHRDQLRQQRPPDPRVLLAEARREVEQLHQRIRDLECRAGPPPVTDVPLVALLLERFAGPGWHTLDTLAEGVGDGGDGDAERVGEVLRTLMDEGTARAFVERRKRGKSYEYQIFPTAGRETVTTEEIRAKLGPILKKLIAEGKKNMATMSPGTVAMLAFEIDVQLKKWGV